MNCSISGQPPVHAVVSLKSGHVFEKNLIEKHLQVTGTCPVTNEPLTVQDLLALKGNSALQPRPPSATSIPGLIQLFQNEWDAVMLETYTLNKHLDNVRQELAHALYQHDAACRVIARLVKERDEARGMLVNTQENVAAAMKKASAGTGKQGEPETGISGEVLKVIENVAKQLTKNRKNRIKELSAEVAQREDIKKYSVSASITLHSPSIPGILCLDVLPTQEEMIVTGGADNNVVVYNRTTEKIVDTLKGHSKKITDVKFHPQGKLVFSTSQDATSIIWNLDQKTGKYAVEHTLKDHSSEVVGCTLHPSGSYLITASTDNTWCFYDINTGVCRQKVSDEKVTEGYSQVSFHPDGIILGCGTVDSVVRIFDVQSQKNAANFRGHTGKVTALSFSENGYYLATGDEKGVVKLWDLRKLQNFHTIPFKSADPIGALEFDQSGSYLAVTGQDVTVYTCKQWETVKTWTDHTKDVTAFKFGKNASWFATASKDRSVKVFSNTN